jgi:hypothetical protein
VDRTYLAQDGTRGTFGTVPLITTHLVHKIRGKELEIFTEISSKKVNTIANQFLLHENNLLLFST